MTRFASKNILVYKGAYWEETFYVVDRGNGYIAVPALLTGETAIDPTTLTFTGQARESESEDADVVFEFGFSKNLTTREITASLDAADTADLTVGETVDSADSRFPYDYVATTASNVPHRIKSEGFAQVSRPITREPSTGFDIDGGNATTEYT